MRPISLAILVFTWLTPTPTVAESPNLVDIDASCKGYAATDVVESSNSIHANLKLIGDGCKVYGPDVQDLKLTVEYQTDSRLHILIQDAERSRYQIPEDIFPRPDSSSQHADADSQLKFVWEADPFSFKVTRRSSGEVLFDTSRTSLIFERQFLRLKTWLPQDPNIYGLGEHIDPLRLKNDDYIRTLWARDSGGTPYEENLYGSHPIYVDHRTTGTHGVFLASSNGMDVKLDQDDNHEYSLEYNILGGVLDLYFFAGPSPADVSRQYAAIIGTPAMVPYWSLGFHQCKYGYRDWFEVAEVVYNHSLAGIPLETMWTDIDYMDHRRVFSLDEGNYPIEKMHRLIDYLHSRQQHYIVMVDPAVADHDYPAYNRGMDLDIFVKSPDKSPFRALVWPGVTVYPDWLHSNATEYWVEQFEQNFNPESGVDIDGVWIDMNEPANFCDFPCSNPEEQAKEKNLPPTPPPVRDPPRSIPGFPEETSNERGLREEPEKPSQLERAEGHGAYAEVDHEGDDLLSPPYRIHNHSPSGNLSDLTMHTDLQHANGLWTYDTHNLYGMMMGMATREAMLHRRPGLRPLIITRSSFAGSGRYVQKWLGDNASRWDHYRSQIAQMLAFASIFQMPMVGSDVCGFIGEATEKLCARWATLGAFNPFFRNHANLESPPQEFYRWPLVTKAAKYAIDIRYRLLDYLYTALARQSADGSPTLSPLWHMYPEDEQTFSNDLQFFYGDSILVSPVTKEDSEKVKIYLPNDLFYEWETRKPVRGHGKWVDLKVPYDRIPLHIRGGSIVPLRSESANTTTELRKKPFEILVAPDLHGKAEGSLYVDDGVSLNGGKSPVEVQFQYAEGEFSMKSSGVSEVALEQAGVVIEKVTVLNKELEDVRDEL